MLVGRIGFSTQRAQSGRRVRRVDRWSDAGSGPRRGIVRISVCGAFSGGNPSLRILRHALRALRWKRSGPGHWRRHCAPACGAGYWRGCRSRTCRGMARWRQNPACGWKDRRGVWDLVCSCFLWFADPSLTAPEVKPVAIHGHAQVVCGPDCRVASLLTIARSRSATALRSDP